jgi:hypothetical protein
MITSGTLHEQAGALAPAEAPQLKTFWIVIAHSRLHLLTAQAPNHASAEDIAWNSYHNGNHHCCSACGDGEAEIIDCGEVQT